MQFLTAWSQFFALYDWVAPANFDILQVTPPQDHE